MSIPSVVKSHVTAMLSAVTGGVWAVSSPNLVACFFEPWSHPATTWDRSGQFQCISPLAT